MLFNFRVNDTNKDRVLFDCTRDCSGLTKTGFTISGKIISSITIDGDGFGGYLTVKSDFVNAYFDFWDNNTIRLESGDGTVPNFDLTYIENNIIEPSSPVNKWVDVTSSGLGDGASPADVATISYAFENAVAGETWWVKAGDYGNSQLSPVGLPATEVLL